MPSAQVIDHVARALAAVTRPRGGAITRKPFADIHRWRAAQYAAKGLGSEAGMIATMKIATHCDGLHARGEQPRRCP